MVRGFMLATLLVELVACSGGAASPTGGSDPLVGRATFFSSGGDVRTGPLRVADSDEERARGLMDQTTLPPNAGMVFVFDDPTEASFWMKDTKIPLSIAFWGDEGRVIDIMEMEPCTHDPCPTYRPGAPYTHALEMNRGWFARRGIEIGDGVELELGTG